MNLTSYGAVSRSLLVVICHGVSASAAGRLCPVPMLFPRYTGGMSGN
jgi:hypothetical protein